MSAIASSAAGLRVALDGRSLTSPITRGMDRYTLGLVRALRCRGVDVTLLHRARQPIHPTHLVDLPCEILGLVDRGGLSWEQVALPRALRRGRFDVYHAPAERGVPLWAPCPTVLTVHSLTTLSYRSLVARGMLPGALADYVGGAPSALAARVAERYWRLQLRASGKILTPSHFTRDELVSLLRVDRCRIDVTPLAADVQFSRPPSGPAARAATLRALGVRRPYLLYVGGFERHKNVSGLLSAFARVRKSRPDVSLVAVGSGRIPEAVGDGVVSLSNLGAQLVDLYDAAELFVSLSWRESFGLPALEALMRGVVPVASAWGASSEVVGRAGRLVDPRDHAGAAAAILALLATDPNGRRNQAKAAAARFSWSATVDATLRAYADFDGSMSSAERRSR